MKKLLYLLILLQSSLFAQYNNTIYFDPTNFEDPLENGTQLHPYDQITDVTLTSNTDYRFKRGTTMEISSEINVNVSNVRFYAYDAGTIPIIHKTTSGGRVFNIRQNTNHIILDSLDIKGYTHVYGGGVTVGVYVNLGLAGNIQNITIKDCNIYNHGVGIASENFGNPDIYVDSLNVINCNVFDIGLDGIFFRNARASMIADCHVYDVNMYWHTSGSHNQDPSGGDCVQLGWNTTEVRIYNNILDRRSTGNKFALACVQKTQTVPLTMYVIGNTLYPPKDTIDDEGGAALQFWQTSTRPETMVVFERNIISGRVNENCTDVRGPGQFLCDTLYMNYNIFDSTNGNGASVITDACNYAEIYNNVFVGGERTTPHVLNVYSDVAIVKNNLAAGNTTYDPLRTTYNGSLDASNNIQVNSSNSSTYNSILGIEDWETSDFRRTGNLNDGVDVSLQYDFENIPVGNPPEIGAYEYTEGGQSNNPPIINNQIFGIDENSSTGQLVGVVLASDPDQGQTLTYSIISGNTDYTFTINSNTGALLVSNDNVLDYEITQSFSLIVKVMDNGTGSLTDQATITIYLEDVNEVPEIFDQDFIVEENSENGISVGIMFSIDPDFNQSITYSILSGNLDNIFYLDPYSGILFVANSSALNYTENPVLNLVVKAQDNGVNILSDQANIDIYLTIGNEAPNIVDQDFSLNENSPSGTAVGIMIASDPDDNQSLTYSIVAGNYNNAFFLDPNSGILFVSNSTILNYESNPEFNLIIQVQDNGPGNLNDQENICISIIDINEPPNIVNQSFEINEDYPNGAMIGIMSAIDPDNSQSMSYLILLGNENGEFYLDPNSGILFIANTSVINYEINADYNIVVQVMDDGPGNLIDIEIISVVIAEGYSSDNGPNNNLEDITGMDTDQESNLVNDFKIFPNPTSNYINIDLSNTGNDNVEINIYSLYGNMVKDIKFNNISESINNRIDISDLEKGTYIIQVKNGVTAIRKKIVKL